MPKKKCLEEEQGDAFALSGHAKILAEFGTETFAATRQLNETIAKSPLLSSKVKNTAFPILAEALKSWKDEEAAAVVQAVRNRLEIDSGFDLNTLRRWIYAHQDNAQAVIDCLAVDPPEELIIIQRLSTAGSQKLVFLANWQIAQREVVLKRFIGPEAAERLVNRESQAHPLSMKHPNIIETHVLKNAKGEKFLVENRLQMVLSDSWSSHGVQEAANLLRDIAAALSFLHDKQLVHGDVKPDNIGYEDGHYILLDFGICRSQSVFSEDPTQTGSLRTRAPELLLDESTHGYASDIWALGATVYNSEAKRFPLFDQGESPPRISKPDERRKFEIILADRIKNEWDKRVDLSLVREPLREPLGKALNRDPQKRCSASDLVKLCESKLAAFLRRNEGNSRFSPSQEIDQLKAYLPAEAILTLMPDSRKHELRRRLQDLKVAKGLSSEQKTDIEAISAQLK
jgi:serine/threonine protein kinase